MMKMCGEKVQTKIVVVSSEVLCAPEDAFEAYQTLQTKLGEVETQVSALTDNTQVK